MKIKVRLLLLLYKTVLKKKLAVPHPFVTLRAGTILTAEGNCSSHWAVKICSYEINSAVYLFV